MVVAIGFAVVELRDGRGVFDFTFAGHGATTASYGSHDAALRFSQQFLGQPASGSVARSEATREQAGSWPAKRHSAICCGHGQTGRSGLERSSELLCRTFR